MRLFAAVIGENVLHELHNTVCFSLLEKKVVLVSKLLLPPAVGGMMTVSKANHLTLSLNIGRDISLYVI